MKYPPTTFPPHKPLKTDYSYLVITDVVCTCLMIYVIEKYGGYDEIDGIVRGIKAMSKINGGEAPPRRDKLGLHPRRVAPSDCSWQTEQYSGASLPKGKPLWFPLGYPFLSQRNQIRR